MVPTYHVKVKTHSQREQKLSSTTTSSENMYVIQNKNFQQQYITHHHCNIISTACFSIIVSYYVQMHKQDSPRKIAIRMMNEVVGLVSNQYIKVNDKISTRFGMDKNEELLPVIANFTRATARNLSHHQHWLLLHSGTMHSLASTLKHVIKKQLLQDIHSSLLHCPSYDCTYCT